MTNPAEHHALARRRRGPFARWPRTTDALLGALLVAGTAVDQVFVGLDEQSGVAVDVAVGIPWIGYVILVVAGASLLWRRRHPIAVTGFNLAVVFGWPLLAYGGDPSLGFLVGVYSVGRYVTETRKSYAVAATTITVSILTALTDQLPMLEAVLLVVVGWLPWYVGRRVMARRAYLDMLEERTAQLEREREAAEQRAVEEERAVIARELHDVVAHRVSMMTVQAGAAKTVGEDSPAAAIEAMAAVEQEGRRALSELRHLLGVLRPDADGQTNLGPQGSLAVIPDVVGSLRDAGYDISLEIDTSDTREIPSRVGLSAYRIIQESLTNVVKHAGPGASVDVSVKDHDGELSVLVSDNGTQLRYGRAEGYGLVGMRERVALLGGSLNAGPQPGGGWRVHARIPLERGDK